MPGVPLPPPIERNLRRLAAASATKSTLTLGLSSPANEPLPNACANEKAGAGDIIMVGVDAAAAAAGERRARGEAVACIDGTGDWALRAAGERGRILYGDAATASTEAAVAADSSADTAAEAVAAGEDAAATLAAGDDLLERPRALRNGDVVAAAIAASSASASASAAANTMSTTAVDAAAADEDDEDGKPLVD